MLRLTWLSICSSFSHSSAALPRLEAACDSDNEVHWTVVRGTLHDRPEELTCRVWATAPEILAATVYLFNRNAVLEVVGRLKALAPECLVVLGGPEWLGDNEHFLRTHPEVNAVFRGEGEVGFPLWLRSARAPHRWKEVPGLCWIDSGGLCHDNGRARFSGELDALPAPTRSRFFDWSKPFVQLETSRGCPCRCTFCTSAGTGPLRHFSVDRVRQELQTCRKHGVRNVRLLDRTFNADPPRARRLLNLFRNEFPDLCFHLEWRPELLTPELLEALRVAPEGQLHLEIGLQSICPTARGVVGRTREPEAALAATGALCELRNLQTHVDLLAGLPNQTLHDVFADVRRTCELGPDEIQLEILKVLPGTPLATIAGRQRLRYAPTPPYEVLCTPQITVEALHTARCLSVLTDRFYNVPGLREGVRAAAGADPEFFPAFLGYVGDERLARPQHLQARFRLLHAFARERGMGAAAEFLEYHWLCRGFSPEHGIALTELWRDRIPPDATLVEGDAGTTSRRRRVWHYTGRDAEYWFSFPTGSDRRGTAPTVYRRCLY
ncbi:MAG: DUF4080 domain-containing protein [Kiritimatiellaeota bacterium]|nr:DUF4080 domain-containing protein [Kiritimatiellota bacterium]